MNQTASNNKNFAASRDAQMKKYLWLIRDHLWTFMLSVRVENVEKTENLE
jgi:hypothetical protein